MRRIGNDPALDTWGSRQRTLLKPLGTASAPEMDPDRSLQIRYFGSASPAPRSVRTAYVYVPVRRPLCVITRPRIVIRRIVCSPVRLPLHPVTALSVALLWSSVGSCKRSVGRTGIVGATSAVRSAADNMGWLVSVSQVAASRAARGPQETHRFAGCGAAVLGLWMSGRDKARQHGALPGLCEACGLTVRPTGFGSAVPWLRTCCGSPVQVRPVPPGRAW